MADFKKVKFWKETYNDDLSCETSYWKNLVIGGSPTQLDGTLNDIAYCPVKPYNYAVTCNFQIQIYSSSTDISIRRIPVKVRPAALTSLAWRFDGSLLGAGDECGQVRIFDPVSRLQLRIFRPSFDSEFSSSNKVDRSRELGNAGVTAVKFTADPQIVASAAQDGTVRLWELSNETKPLLTLQVAKQDQVRCLSVSALSPWLLASGSYDGMARLHDSRCSSSSSPLATLHHEQPLEAVQFAIGDGVLYTAAGTWVTAWSLAQCRPISTFRRHHKTVTRIVLARNGSRLLSAGLDGLLKVTDTLSYSEVHQIEYHHASILSMAMAPDDSSLALGTVDRWLHRRRRPVATQENAFDMSSLTTQPEKYLERVGALGLCARPEDVVQPHVRRPYRLERYERLLRKFRHSDALSEVLSGPMLRLSVDNVCAVLRELLLRNGLKPALAGQPAMQLAKLVNFVRMHLFDTERSELFFTVAEELLDVLVLQSEAEVYICQVNSSGVASQTDDTLKLNAALKRLAGFLNAELNFVNTAQHTLGELDLLLGEISAFTNM